jgi:hypothetical protein
MEINKSALFDNSAPLCFEIKFHIGAKIKWSISGILGHYFGKIEKVFLEILSKKVIF